MRKRLGKTKCSLKHWGIGRTPRSCFSTQWTSQVPAASRWQTLCASAISASCPLRPSTVRDRSMSVRRMRCGSWRRFCASGGGAAGPGGGLLHRRGPRHGVSDADPTACCPRFLRWRAVCPDWEGNPPDRGKHIPRGISLCLSASTICSTRFGTHRVSRGCCARWLRGKKCRRSPLSGRSRKNREINV